MLIHLSTIIQINAKENDIYIAILFSVHLKRRKNCIFIGTLRLGRVNFILFQVLSQFFRDQIFYRLLLPQQLANVSWRKAIYDSGIDNFDITSVLAQNLIFVDDSFDITPISKIKSFQFSEVSTWNGQVLPWFQYSCSTIMARACATFKSIEEFWMSFEILEGF